MIKYLGKRLRIHDDGLMDCLCADCGKWQPETEFYFNGQLKRYSSYCKTCTRVRNRRYNAEKTKDRQRVREESDKLQRLTALARERAHHLGILRKVQDHAFGMETAHRLTEGDAIVDIMLEKDSKAFLRLAASELGLWKQWHYSVKRLNELPTDETP
jgi:hypothetical protein